MFCFQCEQTSKGTGCVGTGVCGKEPETAALQDVLVYVTKGLAQWAHRARKLDAKAGANREADVALIEALFVTVTNVSFDSTRVAEQIHATAKARAQAKERYLALCRDRGQTPETPEGPATFEPAADVPALEAQGANLGIVALRERIGEERAGLTELALYGIKGMAAYAEHAHVLGRDDDTAYAFFHEAMSNLAAETLDESALLGLALRVGEVNLGIMALLDEANTGTYGHPTPTTVRVTPVAGKAILVSGHDLRDLAELLEQTRGKGINIYTHGEMLPAHGYPELHRYEHLVGNYGGAWQDQHKEFDAFPGAILMTTNCIQKPRDSYKNRIFTCGLVSWPGVRHVAQRKFAPVIEAALAAPGFTEDAPAQTITVGFGHEAVLGVADKVIDAVKAGAIRRFFLVGGCDGAKSGRNYFTDLAQALPSDTVILTLACGKFRFNKLDFGTVAGLPRLLDIGQCNDAYSAVQIAVALAKAFDTDVNSLPLSMVLSWYEQKAVCILLSLLHLGIRNIRLGPSLPAFVTPKVLGILSETFNVMPTTTVEKDMAAMLG